MQGRDEFADRTAHPFPGLVLLDLKMPNLTGIEALCEIRTDPAGRELVAVLLTSSTQETDISAARALNANGYFVKPSNATDLIELLKNLAAIDSTKTPLSVSRLEIKGNRLPT